MFVRIIALSGRIPKEGTMKKLCGLACLIVSVLLGGVFVAPLPSEASNPWITISVDATAGGFGSTTDQTIPFDAVSGSSVANGVACASGDAANFNICYKIRTFGESGNNTVYGPPQRQFKILNAIGTDGLAQDARLLINDCDGSNCLEKMIPTGFQIVPTATTWNASLVKVTIKYHNKFDFKPNDPTLGTSTSSYRLPLSLTGVFKETATLLCNAAGTVGCPVNDEFHMWGRGIFCTASNTTDCPSGSTGTKNMDSSSPPTGGGGNTANVDRTTCTVSDSPLCRMYFRVANSATADVRFDRAQQGVDYPGFRCNNGLATTPTFNPLTNTAGSVSGKKCTADVTGFVEFKLYGADTVNVDGSPRMIGGNCGTKQAPPCECSTTGKGKQCLDAIIADFVDEEVDKEKRVQIGIPDAIFCDPETICNGTINNFINLTPYPSVLQSFPFTAIGPDVNNFVVTTASSTADPFTHAFTGAGGTDRTLAPDYNNPDWPIPFDAQQPFYEVDQIIVTRPDGSEVGPPFITVLSCSGGHKGPLIIHDLEGIYNVLWHIHKTNTQGVLCE